MDCSVRSDGDPTHWPLRTAYTYRVRGRQLVQSCWGGLDTYAQKLLTHARKEDRCKLRDALPPTALLHRYAELRAAAESSWVGNAVEIAAAAAAPLTLAAEEEEQTAATHIPSSSSSLREETVMNADRNDDNDEDETEDETEDEDEVPLNLGQSSRMTESVADHLEATT